jgi:DNA-binding FadR family transcriptional regulator
LVDAVRQRLRDGVLKPGDKLPTEAALMEEFGISRTVVREAISKLQAAALVQTRHGVGTFVSAVSAASEAAGFRIDPAHYETLRDVVAVLELRIGVETEAAALAAQRRTGDNLRAMRQALDVFEQTIAEGRDAVAADFQFHLEVARATQNEHYVQLMSTLGAKIIPRARLVVETVDAERLGYLRRVNAEHESIHDAIVNQDAEAARAAMRTHLANSRERRRRAQVSGG